ncbi:MAG: aminotransferase class I/II-fold pyridoxal phosphate-dependent enzyme, partial [Clostridia bacterium]|nr:aminotransferase class I/II-fold pyridoxal phosphate-dependent enzyme [Clostridia bacterium]
MKLNENFFNLKDSYLFATVGRKTAEYKAAHPDKEVIRLSIGDVTRPLAPAVVEAMHRAVDEMSRSESFKGYGPDQTCYGYGALLDSILGSYARKGVSLGVGEIFISDGAKSDCGNILDLFSEKNVVLLPDPVYPAYADANVMAGRKILYADANESNGFLPMPDRKVKADIVYICSPNNPTGAAYTKEQLK